ncbi:MAG: hypothetical protein KDJ90_12070 [Nitratireductor sp.]|nr:hypothetical protein [Nitratireductor sp.]
MTETITFDVEDWRQLSGSDKRAIRHLQKALNDFEPLAKFAGLGQTGVDNLIVKGLAEQGGSCRPSVAPIGYRLTKKGWLAAEWCAGRRPREYPAN